MPEILILWADLRKDRRSNEMAELRRSARESDAERWRCPGNALCCPSGAAADLPVEVGTSNRNAPRCGTVEFAKSRPKTGLSAPSAQTDEQRMDGFPVHVQSGTGLILLAS